MLYILESLGISTFNEVIKFEEFGNAWCHQPQMQPAPLKKSLHANSVRNFSRLQIMLYSFGILGKFCVQLNKKYLKIFIMPGVTS